MILVIGIFWGFILTFLDLGEKSSEIKSSSEPLDEKKKDVSSNPVYRNRKTINFWKKIHIIFRYGTYRK